MCDTDRYLIRLSMAVSHSLYSNHLSVSVFISICYRKKQRTLKLEIQEAYVVGLDTVVTHTFNGRVVSASDNTAPLGACTMRLPSGRRLPGHCQFAFPKSYERNSQVPISRCRAQEINGCRGRKKSVFIRDNLPYRLPILEWTP